MANTNHPMAGSPGAPESHPTEATEPDVAPTPRWLVVTRLAVLAVIALGVVVAWRSGLLARVGDVRQLTGAIADAGAGGQLVFLAAYTLMQPFGVPGTVFIVAAPLIWPWPVAFALSMVGTMGASVVGFVVTRFLARDWMARRIPRSLRRYDAALETNGFRTVFLLRLIFWMPQPLHALFGISRVPFWTHFWASFLGYLAPLLAVSYFGGRLFGLNLLP